VGHATLVPWWIGCSSIPIFLNCGNLLVALRILLNECGITLSIKFCLEHLIRNVVLKFSITKATTGSVHAIMASLQSSPTIDSFITVKTWWMASSDPRLGGKIAAFPLQIHPIHLTVFGNWESQLKENWLPLFQQLSFSSLVAGGELNMDNDHIKFIIQDHVDSTVP
jgi:hypothetical protein